MGKKTNMMDYLDWRGDLTLDKVPFNEVDNIILSMMSFVDFAVSGGDKEKVSLLTAVETFASLPDDEKYMGAIIPDIIIDMAVKAGRSKRFEGTFVCDFVNCVDKCNIEQFSAVTFLLPDKSIFVAFRGTDDSVAGWKEDLLLSLTTGVPAQLKAAEYLSSVAEKTEGSIRVGGHSKGGNLAVYAAVKAPENVQSRIVSVYCNDGPGFLPEFANSAEVWSIAHKIVNLVPEASVVGMLMEHIGKCRIISSAGRSVVQHNPFLWEVRVDRFADKKSRSRFAGNSDRTVKKWVEYENADEKKEIIEAIFAVLDATGAETLTDLRTNPVRCAAAAQKALNQMDKDKRDKAVKVIKEIVAVK